MRPLATIVPAAGPVTVAGRLGEARDILAFWLLGDPQPFIWGQILYVRTSKLTEVQVVNGVYAV